MKKQNTLINACLRTGLLLGLGGIAFSSVVALKNADFTKPASAAISTGQLFVGGVDIKTSSISGASLSGTTLTLNNFNYSGDGYTWTSSGQQYNAGIYYTGSDALTIKVKGNCSINLTNTSSKFRSFGIAFKPNQSYSTGVSKDYNFTGSGTLTVNAGRATSSFGLCSNSSGKIIFEGPTCTFTGGANGMNSYGVGADESWAGIRLSAKSGEVTLIGSKANTSYGARVESLYGDGGTLTCIGGDSSNSYGIMSGSTSVIYGGELTFSSEYGIGWYSSSSYQPTISDSSYAKVSGVCVYGKNGAFNNGFNTKDFRFKSLGWSDMAGTGFGTILNAYSQISSSYKRVYVGGIRYEAKDTEVEYDGKGHAPNVTSSTMNTTIEYSTDDVTYSETAPTFTEVGTYTVHYKISHSVYPTIKSTTKVTVKLKTPTATLPAANTVYFTGEPQALISAGTSTNGTFQYRLGEDGEWTNEVPTATTKGDYSVYYKFTGNTSYANIEETLIPVTIKNAEIKDVSVTVNGKYVVNGQPQTPIVTVTATTLDSATYTFAYSTSSTGTYGDMPSFTEAGNHTIYYQVTALDHETVYGSFTFTIENDKTALVAKINEAEELYNSILEGYPTVASTLNTTIDAAKAVNNNPSATLEQIQNAIDALEAAIAKAKDDSRDIVVDETSGVTIKTDDGTGIPTEINLKVELKQEVKAEKDSDQYKAINEMLEGNERIYSVYDIKLVRIVSDNEVEVPLSEIKDGMKLIIRLPVPQNVDTEKLRILQIRDENDMEFIEFTVENNELTFEVSTLSELAIVAPREAGISPGAVVGIVIGSLLLVTGVLYVLAMFVFHKWIMDNSKALRAFRIGKKDGKVRLFTMLFTIRYREESEVFNTKEEALGAKQQ